MSTSSAHQIGPILDHPRIGASHSPTHSTECSCGWSYLGYSEAEVANAIRCHQEPRPIDTELLARMAGTVESALAEIDDSIADPDSPGVIRDVISQVAFSTFGLTFEEAEQAASKLRARFEVQI